MPQAQSESTTRDPFRPAPHENAEPHRRLMEQLRKMDSTQLFRTLVDAGIFTADKRLTTPYGGDADPPTDNDGSASA